MTVYTYTGKLTDAGETPFPGAQPRLWVEPVGPAYGRGGPIATKRIPVTVAPDGTFSVALVASVDTVPPVRYLLRVEWLDANVVLGYTEWEFNAAPGGGTIKPDNKVPLSVWWVGPPWPPEPLPPGFYLDVITNDVGRVG